jgi:hypothetical protein
VRIVRLSLSKSGGGAGGGGSAPSPAPGGSTTSSGGGGGRGLPSGPRAPSGISLHTTDVVFDHGGQPLQRMAAFQVACLPSVAAVEPQGGCDTPRTPYTLTGVHVDPCVTVCYNASAGFGTQAPPEVLSLRLLQVGGRVCPNGWSAPWCTCVRGVWVCVGGVSGVLDPTPQLHGRVPSLPVSLSKSKCTLN